MKQREADQGDQGWKERRRTNGKERKRLRAPEKGFGGRGKWGTAAEMERGHSRTLVNGPHRKCKATMDRIRRREGHRQEVEEEKGKEN